MMTRFERGKYYTQHTLHTVSLDYSLPLFFKMTYVDPCRLKSYGDGVYLTDDKAIHVSDIGLSVHDNFHFAEIGEAQYLSGIDNICNIYPEPIDSRFDILDL